MRKDALEITYGDLVQEGAAEFLRGKDGSVEAVLLTKVDHVKLAAVEEMFAKELDIRFAENDRLQREAARRLDQAGF